MEGHSQKVEQQFGAVVEAYLASEVHRQGADLETIKRRVRETEVSDVLDLGCGGGHVSFAIAPFVRSVTAYDLSADMLRMVVQEAERLGFANLQTQQGRAESLPFADATFDMVCTRYSAHHWSDVGKALRETRRVLKPGGLLIAIDCVGPENPLYDTHLQAIELLRDPSHVRDYSSKEWNAMLGAAGFVVRSESRGKLLLNFLAWVTRMRTPAPNVELIRSLLQEAPQEVRDYFQVKSDSSFTLDITLIEAA